MSISGYRLADLGEVVADDRPVSSVESSEHLNLEAVARVLDARDVVDEARRDGGLVVERELDRDDRQVLTHRP